MKRIIVCVLDFVFNLLCNMFHCNFKHLDDAYQKDEPVSPKELKRTLMYKRLKRFVKICILFKNYDLVLDVYYNLPRSIGRCVWYIIKDETKYNLHFTDNYIILGKWVKGKFIGLAFIKEEKETIIEKEDDLAEDNEEDIEYFDGESIHRPNASVYDAMLDYYVGYVYPDGEESFYRNSNIPSGYICIPVYCKDGMFFAFMTEEEIRGYTEGLEEEEEE